MEMDWGFLGEGIANTGSMIAEALLDKWMKKKEMEMEQEKMKAQYEAEQKMQESLADQNEKRWYSRSEYEEENTIESEGREDDRYWERWNKVIEKDKEMADFELNLKSKSASFYNNPEYQGMAQRMQSGQGSDQDRINLTGIQNIMSKQSRFDPLTEEDINFMRTLPPSMQNMMYSLESGTESFRQEMNVRMKQAEATASLTGARVPYYEGLAGKAEADTEVAKGKVGKDARDEIDDIGKQIVALEKDIATKKSSKEYLMADQYKDLAGRGDLFKKEQAGMYNTLAEASQQNLEYVTSAEGRLEELRARKAKLEMESSGEADLTGEGVLTDELMAQAREQFPDLTDEEIKTLYKLYEKLGKKK